VLIPGKMPRGSTSLQDPIKWPCNQTRKDIPAREPTWISPAPMQRVNLPARGVRRTLLSHAGEGSSDLKG
jgi:hypothetical protein